MNPASAGFFKYAEHRRISETMLLFRSHFLGMMISALIMLGAPILGSASPCDRDDFESQVSGASQCLLMKRYGTASPKGMVIWLHGDLSSGAPANYHFALAEQTAQLYSAREVMAVAIVRPGYPDGSGRSSSVDSSHAGRSDHYTRENILEIAGAITHLRKKFSPDHVILVGHSGGAAISAVIAGMQPGLIDALVLVACPCDLARWRLGRREWTRSESPSAWIDKVPVTTRIFALTGSKDNNTSPELADIYTKGQRTRGLDATFEMIPDATHNSAIRAAPVFHAIARALDRTEKSR